MSDSTLAGLLLGGGFFIGFWTGYYFRECANPRPKRPKPPTRPDPDEYPDVDPGDNGFMGR